MQRNIPLFAIKGTYIEASFVGARGAFLSMYRMYRAHTLMFASLNVAG